MNQNATKAKSKDNNTSVTKTKTASKKLAANLQQGQSKKQMPSSSTNTYFRCIVCKGNHRLWECRAFKEKTPTRRAKLMADKNFCFSCLRDKHTFRQCPPSRKCQTPMGEIVRITHYCMEQIGFSQQNSQQIPILSSLLETQVKVKQLLVKSRLIRQQRCHQLLNLRSSFR